MPEFACIGPSDDDIRLRSYLIWEREGSQDGRSREYWLKGKAELEAEIGARCTIGAIEGCTTRFAMPLLPISQPPLRTVARRLCSNMPSETPESENALARGCCKAAA